MSINVNFNLRKPNSVKETPINVIVRYKGVQLVLPSGISIHPQYWESDKRKGNSYQKVKRSYYAFQEMNLRLDEIKSYIVKEYYKLVSSTTTLPTKEQFKEAVSVYFNINVVSQNKDSVSLLNFIDKHIVESTQRYNDTTGKLLSTNTIKPYKTLRMHLKTFQSNYNRKVCWNTLDGVFYRDFTYYLASNNLRVNSIGKQFQVLNSFIGAAEKIGVIPTNTIPRFKVLREQVENIILTKSELEDWKSLDLSNNPRLDKARDIFTLSCYTGARYSDISKFNKNNIVEMEGMKCFEIVQQKTQTKIIVPIHPEVKLILLKYNGIINNIPCGQKMNKYLKEIGSMIQSLKVSFVKKYSYHGKSKNISMPKWKHITTHTGRRTFASHQVMDGVPSQIVMNVTGHKTEKDFRKYIHIDSQTNGRLLFDHWTKRRTFTGVDS